MTKKTVHVVSHSHWDREWYMPFEKFRLRLVDLMDQVIELLESDESGFDYFHLDGHVLLVEDYLEIRQDRKDRVKALIAAGKLLVGPWYVLQDAFLTSGEAQLRNLQLGIELAEQLGGNTQVGYFPDTFGNISQSPQMLIGFGIESAVFGRGINAIAENNKVMNDDDNGYHSELWWEAPDGSKVLSIFMANWYHNGMELPTDPAAAKERAKMMLSNVERFATTPHLLVMNGCDHQPVQQDVGKAIDVLNEHVADYDFVHSNFPEYIKQVGLHSNNLQTIIGELNSQETNGWMTLVNTASARMYLKQWNSQVQVELERWSEPFSTVAWKLGVAYPEAFLDHAWKQLLQNHPHDSICGCSVDEVHEEMVVRFKKAYQIAESLSSKALASITERVDTLSLSKLALTDSDQAEHSLAIVVFNPLTWGRDDFVETHIDVEEELDLGLYVLSDQFGVEVAFSTEDMGWIHGFTLPDDRFRIPWKKRRYLVSFQAIAVPAFGHTTYLLAKKSDLKDEITLKAASIQLESESVDIQEACLENEYIKICAQNDGSLHVHMKQTGKSYTDALVFENYGDIGNEYSFRAPAGDIGLTTSGKSASIKKISSSELLITYELLVPKSREGDLRSKETASLILKARIFLRPHSRRIEVKITGDNQALDHRLRVLFPTDIVTDSCYADSPFDIVRRAIEPWSGWENPSKAERMQLFVDVNDSKNGLMIAAKGLPEFEILRDGRNSIALTLLRCVGELGDWNYFPTPEAQCLGTFFAEFAIIPHPFTHEKVIKEAHAFQTALRAMPTTLHEGEVEASKSWISIPSNSILLTSIKRTRKNEQVMIRCVNLGMNAEELVVEGVWVEEQEMATEAKLNETAIASVKVHKGQILMDIPSKKMTTLLF